MRIGIVTADPIGKDYWKLRYTDPSTGRDVRRKVYGNKKEIEQVCGYISTEVLKAGGYLPENLRSPSIEDGFKEALEHTKAGQAQRARRETGKARFLDWLAKSYPRVQTWRGLAANHLWEYEKYLEKVEGLKPDSIRLRVEPVRFAWKRLHLIYPESIRDVPESLYQQKGTKRRQPEALETGAAWTFLEWLRQYAYYLYPVALMQAMTGCRMMEGALIRLEDVDLEKGMVTFTPYEYELPGKTTSHHAAKQGKVKRMIKNDASERTIPVAPTVLAMLLKHVETHVGQYPQLFLNSRGWPWTHYAISHSFTANKRVAAAKPKKADEISKHANLEDRKRAMAGMDNESIGEIMARRLRATFNDTARRAGCPEALIDVYMGHAPATVQAKFYTQHGEDEFRALALAVDRAWHNPGILDLSIFSDCCKQIR